MKGVIYIAIGDKYINEAIYSCKTLKKYNDIQCTLFSAKTVNHEIFDSNIVIKESYHPWKLKPLIMNLSPYIETLYIDTDTEIRGSIVSPFELLGKNVFVLAPVRNYVGNKLQDFVKKNPFREEIPRLNTGVIYFNKSKSTSVFLESWHERIGKNNGVPILGVDCDQSQFNEMISEKKDITIDVEIKVIPNTEYNCRMYFIPHLHKSNRSNIKIVHQHYMYIKDIRKYFLNSSVYFRILKEKIIVLMGNRIKY